MKIGSKVKVKQYVDYNGDEFDPGIGIIKSYSTTGRVIVEFQKDIPGLTHIKNVDEVPMILLEEIK